jgi:uncharacterized membrane protein
MDFLLISLVLLGLALVATVVLVFVKWNKRKTGEVKEINYQAFFSVGVVFLGAGIAMSVANPGLFGIAALGIVYMIIGLANRDKWKKKS